MGEQGLASWIASVKGRRITAPGGLGGQCVDLADDYIRSVYGLAPIRSNAVDWYYSGIPGWEGVGNNPTNYPKPGDLIVWRENAVAGTGVFGHIAIVLAADQDSIISIDQNWDHLQRAQVVAHDYHGVVGWLTRSNVQ